MRAFFFYFTISFIIFSCGKSKKSADLLIYNANIVDAIQQYDSSHNALAIKDGMIVAIASEKELKKNFNFKTEFNAERQFLHSGFHDAHAHFYGYGTHLAECDLVGTKSFEEAIDRVVNYAKNHPQGWIVGRGWDQNDWTNKEFPNNTLLNEIFPERPVALRRIDGHAVLANNAALNKINWPKNYEIDGGEVLLNNGKPTGVLIDKAADLLLSIIPDLDQSQKIKALKLAEQVCFKNGLTQVTDAGLNNDVILLIDSLQKNGDLKIKINAMVSADTQNLPYWDKNGALRTKRINVQSLKLYADGALGSRGAKLKKPYCDRKNYNGIIYMTPEEIKYYCDWAKAHNFQVNTHCIGDSAAHLLLTIYSNFLEQGNDKRWRIEHAQVLDTAEWEMMRKYNVIPSVQPTHATSDMYWAEERLCQDRMIHAYNLKSLLAINGYIPLGTDFPVEDVSPINTFYAAVYRQDLKGYPKEGFRNEEAIKPIDALKGITHWASKAAFTEDKTGCISLGKAADFTLLNKNISRTHHPTEIEVKAVFVEGEKVYEK